MRKPILFYFYGEERGSRHPACTYPTPKLVIRAEKKSPRNVFLQLLATADGYPETVGYTAINIGFLRTHTHTHMRTHRTHHHVWRRNETQVSAKKFEMRFRTALYLSA